MFLHELMEVKEYAAPVHHRRSAPCRERSLRRSDSRRNFLMCANRDLSHGLPRCRIVLNQNLAARNLWTSIYVDRTRLKLRGNSAGVHGEPPEIRRATNLRGFTMSTSAIATQLKPCP